jgi:hypothetical protein
MQTSDSYQYYQVIPPLVADKGLLHNIDVFMHACQDCMRGIRVRDFKFVNMELR